MMRIISYYTKNTLYEEVFNNYLKPSLDKFNLTYDVEAIENKGNWYKNTAYKATCIKKMLNKYKSDIIYIDVDAKIVKFPQLLFEIPRYYDLAYHRLSWFEHWKNGKGDRYDLLSGTMLWRYNYKVLELVDKYEEAVKEDIQTWEQRKLQKLIEGKFPSSVNDTALKGQNGLKIYTLPPQYATVIMHNNELPYHYLNGKEPVIIHYQKSREFKRQK